MEVIAEHSVDLSLLPEKAKILDIGCLGFGFTDAMVALGHYVASVDIQMLPGGRDYFHCGISDYIGFCELEMVGTDIQATRLVRSSRGIPCWTLEAFSQNHGVSFWDLIKIDVEGSEYEIIMSLEKAPAKQLSIEFHLHTGVYGQTEMLMMEDKLKSLGYEAVSHEYEERHCAGKDYWNSLFILL